MGSLKASIPSQVIMYSLFSIFDLCMVLWSLACSIEFWLTIYEPLSNVVTGY